MNSSTVKNTGRIRQRKYAWVMETITGAKVKTLYKARDPIYTCAGGTKSLLQWNMRWRKIHEQFHEPVGRTSGRTKSVCWPSFVVFALLWRCSANIARNTSHRAARIILCALIFSLSSPTTNWISLIQYTNREVSTIVVISSRTYWWVIAG